MVSPYSNSKNIFTSNSIESTINPIQSPELLDHLTPASVESINISSLKSASESALNQPIIPQSPTVESSPRITDLSGQNTDFDGDGKADLFWTNTENGERHIWLMDGTTVRQKTFLQTLDLAWDTSFTDFNNDGKTDVLLRNYDTGENAIWLMDGAKIANGALLGTLGNNPETAVKWQYGIGDFNGDRKSDLFWHNESTGENAVWLIDGTSLTSGAFLDSTDVSELGDRWRFGVGDFNGDGKSDIFSRNYISGINTVWLMNGVNIADGNFLSNVGSANNGEVFAWEFDLGDFNNDGKTDLFWRNDYSGENAIWLMNGKETLQTNFTESLGSEDNAYQWDFQLGDFNGDGKTGIFWRNYTTGENATWQINGTNLVNGEFLSNLPESSTTDWNLPAILDLDGDGTEDLLWRNSASTENAVWLINNGKISTGELIPQTGNKWQLF
ncbi:MAG: VCBS repeat-containing protein [Cyanobacteria bacterium P01_A01_bin.84]